MTDALLIGAEELENLGTRYLAAVLRENGYTVHLAAFSTAAEMDAVLRLAERLQPRLAGLSIIFQYRAPEFLELARRLRDRLPGVHITTGGHFPTFRAAELLRDYPALDSVVRGEGEQTLLDLMAQLETPARWAAIPGFSFRAGEAVVENPPRPLLADLDALPFPARDTPPQRHLGVGYAPILGSRGCYRNCAFCSIQTFYGASAGRGQRFRSVPDLVDEMEVLYRGAGVRFFVFNDDEWFPAGRARLARVAGLERELGRRGLDLMMSIKCRADDVDEPLFRRLRDMGVVRAYVGVESGSDRALRAMNKHTTVAQNRRALEILNRTGMLADFGLIFFDPDSTVEDVRANLAFFHEMAGAGQAPLSFGRMEVYAGTPMEARLLAEGRLMGSYMAWNYSIADPRVELVFRLMIACMRHRHYDNDGLGKQCSVACYEHMMYRYRLRERADPALEQSLRSIVARANGHSLRLLEEMLAFALEEDIYNVRRVNEQAGRWASDVNGTDLELLGEIAAWRERVAADVAALEGATSAPNQRGRR
ncbi:MAG: B12-binding domain-containing radical SAM protein [Anaerolineae bacterium]